MTQQMIPAGYMAKRVQPPAGWLKAPQVSGVYSVSACVNDDFADYIEYWKHNGYWLFDSPAIIQELAKEHSISLDGISMFYYEVSELQFDGESWQPYSAEASFTTNVQIPVNKTLEGYDIVTFYVGTSPEHSPLSCNSMAEEIETNSHCLLKTYEAAEDALNSGVFKNCEPGPYRIFAVYSLPSPDL